MPLMMQFSILSAFVSTFSGKIHAIKGTLYPFFFPFRRIFLHNNFYDMGYTKDLVFPDRIKYFPGESHHLFFPHALLDE